MERLIVPRTVTVVDGERSYSAPLEEFRSARAYVLLGDPGAGKTEAFRVECEGHDDGEFITARRFIRKGTDRLSDWVGKTLFIDGLDEVRAGSSDPRRPLDQVLERLERLGRPTFRLSCRAADWLGRNDLREIASGAGYEELAVLQLEPLSGDNIAHIVADLGLPDSRAFVAEADDRGLGGMLGNPHSLGLLVNLALGGEWPKDRRGTMDLACRKLAREWNDQHLATHQSATRVSTDRILAAAGQLCAHILLSDKDHVSTDASDADSLCLEDLSDGDQTALLRAVKSNLFGSQVDGGLAPVHRQVADFLAAGFLHDRIEAGVPARRVMALMVGEDGVVVTELRGPSAWLAAVDRTSRLLLVQTDPVGVALYGDISGFPDDDIVFLLQALADRADEIREWEWSPLALASLIRHRTLDLLAQYVSSKDRSDRAQAVVGLLIHALASVDGPRERRLSLEGALDDLDRAVRDSAWQPWVRQAALRALIRHSTGQEVPTLFQLLDDLRDGTVDDRDSELLGSLLRELYPAHVGPGRIWDYLLPHALSNRGGKYHLFWTAVLPRKTQGHHAVTLLEALETQRAEFRAYVSDHRFRGLSVKLVEEALAAGGDSAAVSSVYDWLELIRLKVHTPRSRQAASVIRQWLAARRGLQRRLALEGLRRVFSRDESAGSKRTSTEDQGSNNRPTTSAAKVSWLVYGGDFPEGFSEWCVQEAGRQADNDPEVAVALLKWSQPWRDGDSGLGLPLEQVRMATEAVPVLRQQIDKLVVEHNRSATQMEAVETEFREETAEYEATRRAERARELALVREHVDDLKHGRCPPGLLHHLAQAYHDYFDERQAASPLERLDRLLDGQDDLVEAAILGLCRISARKDLPTLQALIRLDEEGKMSLFALPILAGLDIMSSESLDSLSDAEVARAAALYYLTSIDRSGHPAWYSRALKSRHRAVAKALVKVTRSRVRKRRHCIHLQGFARQASHREVARLAAVPLLRAFPTRCTEPQISTLSEVLVAALTWRADGLQEFVEQRVGRTSQDVSQQALWLAAGSLLSPDRYVPKVVTFLEEGEEARSRQLVGLLAPGRTERWAMPWRTAELNTMIELLGSRFSPWQPESFGVAQFVDEDRMKVEALISDWASTLASRTTPDACEALQGLVDNPDLEPWRIILKGKRDEQVAARRHTTFRIPDLVAVQRTLENAAPANPADLTALVADRLELLGREIRYGGTDDWRPFWNGDDYGHPIRPKREESCCKALLRALKSKLPKGVDAQREAVYTRGNKSDIRVFFHGHAIPVEIKKDYNTKLWRAVANQLVPKYNTAPESSGFGIFLVLWFGQGKTPVPLTGRRPKTPEELCARLEEHLTEPYRHKISVIVIDVSAKGELVNGPTN